MKHKPSIGKYKALDLGCGRNKTAGAFGVDFVKLPGVDLVWDLNKCLPSSFFNHFEKVVNNCVLDHIGNPMAFLEGCFKYLKKGGEIEIVIDNADYWRYHIHKGNYHADIWEKDAPNHPETHHKMMFQLKHITKMLALAGFKVTEAEYFRDYKGLLKGHIDFLMPKVFGCNMMRIKAVKQ